MTLLVSETDTSFYKTEVLPEIFSIFSMNIDYIFPPKLQKLLLILARRRQMTTQIYYKLHIKTDGLID